MPVVVLFNSNSKWSSIAKFWAALEITNQPELQRAVVAYARRIYAPFLNEYLTDGKPIEKMFQHNPTMGGRMRRELMSRLHELPEAVLVKHEDKKRLTLILFDLIRFHRLHKPDWTRHMEVGDNAATGSVAGNARSSTEDSADLTAPPTTTASALSTPSSPLPTVANLLWPDPNAACSRCPQPQQSTERTRRRTWYRIWPKANQVEADNEPEPAFDPDVRLQEMREAWAMSERTARLAEQEIFSPELRENLESFEAGLEPFYEDHEEGEEEI
ncbi:hypothetical protein N7535_002192 [Penicillium sp. DV-2018c]|nr:hypothetical protein N7461_004563 [Penicillium sp. DV-2018c]KAJ5583572.1 hypothetical protein N7535_002192 [Penicillium sp. DV-2018c]